MKKTGRSRVDSSFSSLEDSLRSFSERFSIAEETRRIAGQIRDEALRELHSSGKNCPEKQKLVDSLRVERGPEKDEYLVISDGKYGNNLEFGTRNSPESPWFIPAFATVTRLIHTCRQGILKRAILKARRLPARR